MYIYNITFNIEIEIETEWLSYIKAFFIPEILKSKYVQSALTSKIVSKELEGISYSIQFTTKSKAELERFINMDFYPVLDKLYQKFHPKMLFFGTELDVIDQQ